MNHRALILDTNILWNIDLCRRLSDRVTAGELQVFIPTLVHAERIRQIAEQHGRDFAIDVVRQFIADSRFDLLPLTAQQAETVADIWLQLQESERTDQYWHANRFDIVLCAIARSMGYTLVTLDTGSHFALVPNYVTIADLEVWLAG